MTTGRITQAGGLLELRDVVKHFQSAGERVHAVDGVSLSLQRGEMLALRGPSGSGKTTLLLLAAALLRPDRGTVYYERRALGSPADSRACDYLMRDVGFVYQRSHLMPKVSAIENASIKLVLGGMSMRAAKAAAAPWLERVGLGDRLEHTTEQLSGGERQRVAIARALVSSPAIVLADEPTGNLDTRNGQEILELLRALNTQGTTVLVITHDREIAATLSRRVELRDGRLIHDETPSQ
jgi:putative ABC transport system ATP-binding protein